MQVDSFAATLDGSSLVHLWVHWRMLEWARVAYPELFAVVRCVDHQSIWRPSPDIS